MALRRFLDNENIEIDNNAAERALRSVAVGRKNWLFSSSVLGATASADLYSLIVTAKQNGLNTYDYLKKVLTEMPKHKAKFESSKP